MPDQSDTTPKPEASEEPKEVKQEEAALATDTTEEVKKEEPEDSKRSREAPATTEEEAAKKQKTTQEEDKPEPAPVLAAKDGISSFNDADVLSGRGGGTNVHPGNRNFRDLINLHRRAYLKARKNDKPSISRTIVRTIRENNGRFLKKDDKSGLWFEIGDDAAREKTSQALRQRAPEMRKLLFDTEREEARAVAEEHLLQQRMMMSMPPEAMQAAMANMSMPGGAPNPMAFANPAFFMAAAAAQGKNGMPMPQPPNPEVFQQMYANMNMNMMGNQMGGVPGGGSGAPTTGGGSGPAPAGANAAARSSNAETQGV